MSLKHSLAKVLLLVVLEVGAVAGVPMTPDKIRKLLQLMNETQVTRTVRNDKASPDPP